ncbi:MAG TPA: GNAT family N-acetyltransferase [Bacillaceae bacterium]|nr:GNAT family N-acetyltransferase [Paenibacillus bovis]HLU21068.1 GNAT family N-acetyltransferase [Bacillaceae bacterium]
MVKHHLTYKHNALITAEQLSNLYKASTIKRPYDDLDRIQKMIEHADIIITAWDGEKLVGIARAVTDYSYCCYLSDLAVDIEYQKQGIGKELIHLLQEKIGEEVALILLSAPTAMEYYPQLGFDTIQNGFIIPRKR